ncbi:hypothetical protein Acr_08g0015030 [Actinidia rufa]|uniref:Uncharacterized protein n=1 Tax=Actinidia rufa TaxID=165716 RepID=A0A7J0F593_9ERIC|nr:hypothetical protein Acr_08g0015030 [Actinidia rufa]
MFSLKDKVTEKLSHLFSDSSPSQSPPLDQSQPQVLPSFSSCMHMYGCKLSRSVKVLKNARFSISEARDFVESDELFA